MLALGDAGALVLWKCRSVERMVVSGVCSKESENSREQAEVAELGRREERSVAGKSLSCVALGVARLIGCWTRLCRLSLPKIHRYGGLPAVHPSCMSASDSKASYAPQESTTGLVTASLSFPA